MIALAIALCALLASSLAGVAWLGLKLFRAVDDDGDRRVAITAMENEIEIARYENERITAALDAARERINAMEKQISVELSAPYSTNASGADLANRIKLLAAQWRNDATEDDHDPGDTDAVPVGSPAD